MSSLGHSLVGSAGRGPVRCSERHSLHLVIWVWIRPIVLSLAANSNGCFLGNPDSFLEGIC